MHCKESIAVIIESLAVSLIVHETPNLWAVNLLTLGAVTSINPNVVCKTSLVTSRDNHSLQLYENNSQNTTTRSLTP
jgi:hypothetical protein